MGVYQYPYGNTQELNLDWFLNAFVEFTRAIENMIAPQYEKKQYLTLSTLVIHNHKLYYNTVEIAVPEDFNAEHWTEITIAEIVGG